PGDGRGARAHHPGAVRRRERRHRVLPAAGLFAAARAVLHGGSRHRPRGRDKEMSGLIHGVWMLILGGTLLFGARLEPVKPAPPKAIAIAVVSLLVGPISMLWGVWGCISAVLSVAWIADWPVYWATFLASSILQGVAGLALSLRAPELLWAAN